jgi:dipeptidyl aminopeptidase
MKYPKPGYPNPLVTVHVFDLGLYLEESKNDDMQALGLPLEHSTLTLDWEARKPATDGLIFEVAWVGNTTLLLKEVNRNADDGNVVVFNLDDLTISRTRGRVVRKLGKNGEEGDDGWIEAVSLIDGNFRRLFIEN